MARRSIRPLPPHAETPDLPHELDAGPPWRRGFDADSVEWVDGSGTVEAPYATISESRIDGGSYDRIDAGHATLRDLDLRNVAAASITLRGAHLRRVRVSGGRIGTLDLADADVNELIIENARVDYLTLSRASASDVLITATRFGSIDAPAATLTRISFTGSRTDDLDLRDARNTDVDLRGLDVAHHLDVRGLAGTTMGELQVQLTAAAFATALGVDVRD